MPKFEYIICNRDYKEETTENFLIKLNNLGEKNWEVVCKLSCLLSNFEQILLKRIKEN